MRHRGGPFGPGWGWGGPGGPGFGGPGFGGPGVGPGFGGPGRGRKRRGDVRTALLLLLNEAPANGYGLMQSITDRSGGEWRPSPGSVYPALNQLEDEGLIRSVENPSESGRTFEITDAGRQAVAERGEAKAPWEPEDLGPAGDTWGEFRKAISSTAKAAAQVAHDGTPENLEAAVKILADARRQLYRLLAGEDE
jgi:DNA-binding PadR family transcriptional regulator